MAEAKKRKKPKGFLVRLIICAAIVLLLVLAYLLRADDAYIVHIWPMWAWTPLVLLPWLSLRFWRQWQGLLGSLGAWIVILMLFGEPTPAELIPTGHGKPQASSLRVVSLNCAGGMLTAAEEVFTLDPDIILLQESPSAEKLADLSEKRLGHNTVVVGPDCAVLAVRPPQKLLMESNYVLAEVRGLRVLSLRLQPPVLRFDLFSPSAWAAYRRDIERRAGELTEIKQKAGLVDLVAGDFNTPNSRRIGGVLKGMKEAKGAIHGWGSTAINDYPMVRIDQIWSGDKLVLINSFVVKSQHSDHRLSVADYAVAKSP